MTYIRIPADHEERRRLAFGVAKKRGYEIISIDPSGIKKMVEVICLKCGVKCKPRRLDIFIGDQQSFKCCANKEKKVPPKENFDVLLKERGHVLCGPAPLGRYDNFVIYCPKHNVHHTTNFEKYAKRKTGMPCCGCASSAKSRITTGESVGRPNPPWRISYEMNVWRINVRKAFGHRCFISGKSSSEERLETHHPYDAATHEKLRYDTRNGLLLGRKLHRSYHKWVGFQNSCTPQSFVLYLQHLLVELDNGRYDYHTRQQILDGIAFVERLASELKSLC